MAMAVRRASLPMRNTTVFPLRSTPVASAKTLGRPSNTKPTTPSGLRRCSTRQPGWSIRSTTASRPDGRSRHVRRPATMSARIDGDSTRRVLLRPVAVARSTSSALASAIGPNTLSSSSRRANSS